MLRRTRNRAIGWIVAGHTLACGSPNGEEHVHAEGKKQRDRAHQVSEELAVDSATGIPIATTFQHPVRGFDASHYGFGFGQTNQWFCLKTAPDKTCASYGAHLGRDTDVAETPEGTEVVAPADGVVRVTTDVAFGGYGSDTKANPNYNGCVVVLEHLLGNGQAVTTLLGHVNCGSGPAVGTLVKRGDPLATIAHYWHGAGKTTDWHHVHWAMRTGRFTATRYEKADLLPYVQGYAPASEFKKDSVTGVLTHPLWLDPFAVVAANGSAEGQAQAHVRHHPPGSFLKDPEGTYWLVTDDETIAAVPPGTARSDRYPLDAVIPISHEEVGCYTHGGDIISHGPVTLYVRPGTNAVVMAYDLTKERYDVINWETFLSWGFTEGDIQKGGDPSFYEREYENKGFRLLRPGTLVKAHESAEVSLITPQQTRLPIASEEVFLRAGFQWNRITSVPESVITEVAGPRENRVFTEEDLEECRVPTNCPGGGICGGGGVEPEPVPEPIPEPTPEPVQPPIPEQPEEEPHEEQPQPNPEPPPVETAEPPTEPVPSPTPPAAQPHLTLTVSTLTDMDGFSLWVQSGSLYATPEDTAADCQVAEQFAICTVMASPARPLEFWMYTGVAQTPWSPGLNWETNECDSFADVAVWRGSQSVPLRMEQVDDGCHFVIDAWEE